MAKWVKGVDGDWAWKSDDGQYLDSDPNGSVPPGTLTEHTGATVEVGKPELDTSKELTGLDRLRYSAAFDTPEKQLQAIKGLGKTGVIENGKAYVIEGGKKYQPDSPDLTWQDVVDVPAVLPEALLSTAGEVVAGPAGAGTGGGIGTYIRHKGAQLAGVTPKDAPFPAYEIGESAVINAAAPKVLRAIGSGVKAVAKWPAEFISGGAGNAMIEQAFNVPAQSVKQAFGVGGRELAENVAKGDTMLSVAARLAKAPADIEKAAGAKFGALKDKAIRSDVYADVTPVASRFDAEIKALELPDATGESVLDVLPEDLAVIDKARSFIERLKALELKGKATGAGGVSSAQLEQYRNSINSMINSRGGWDKSYKDLGAGDRVLRGLYGEIKDELERSADRLYAATGEKAANEWRQSKIDYRMAREFADQLADSFGVDVKDIGGNAVYDMRDAGRVAQTLRNITNAPKESQAILLRDLKRIAPKYAKEVDEVFGFAESKPWLTSETTTTGKGNRPLIMAGLGMNAGAGIGGAIGGWPGAAAGGVAGFMGGASMASKLAPQSAIEWLPGIGETTRNVSAKVAGAARGMEPLTDALTPIGKTAVRQATVETVRRNTGNEAQASELRPIGKLAPATDAPESLVRDVIEAQKAPALEYVNTHYRQLLDKYRAAGMADDDAAMAVVRDIGTRKKNGGRVAPFIENMRRELRTAGYDVKDSDVIDFMNAVQE